MREMLAGDLVCDARGHNARMTTTPAEMYRMIRVDKLARMKARTKAERRAKLKQIAKARVRDTLDYQEAENATEPFMLRVYRVDPDTGAQVPVREKSRQVRRRKQDARTWESFNTEQEVGVEVIAKTYAYLAGRTGFAGSSTMSTMSPVSPSPVSVVEDEYAVNIRRERAFHKWLRDGVTKGVSIAAALDWIVFGMSHRDIDRKHRKRNGFSSYNLISSVDVFLEIYDGEQF